MTFNTLPIRNVQHSNAMYDSSVVYHVDYDHESGHSDPLNWSLLPAGQLWTRAYARMMNDAWVLHTPWLLRYAWVALTDPWVEIYAPVDIEAAAYLAENQDLVDVLRRAIPYLKLYFPGSRVSLKLWDDVESGRKHLFACVLTSLPVEDALDRLEEMDQKWFVFEDASVRERMTFDVQHPTL